MPRSSPPSGGTAAPAWGYDGGAPGPTLQVGRGEEVRIRLVNDLPEPTAVHWHGVRLANAMDGAPPLTQAPIAPGKSFDYRFVAPDAGTYWYHPPGQMGHGLYGMLIVHEAEPVDVDRDVALILDDSTGHVIVNGAAFYEIRARLNERLRLRFLNASPSAIFALRLAGLRTFVMATDGQPVVPFVARGGRLVLGPGNRLDAFVDCGLKPGESTPIVLESADTAAPIASIACETGEPARPAPRDDPQPLPPNGLPERMDFRGAFRLDATIGRQPGRDGRPLFTVKRGRTVMLGFSNTTSESRSIHLHGHSFRLLDSLDDGWKPFWLDTIPIAPQGDVRIAFVADNLGKWALQGLGQGGSAKVWFEVA